VDRILGFAGGSLSGFVAWITGLVNLENIIEVFIISVIGGIGGVVANWIGRWIINKFDKKIKDKK
jgi:predicted CDP-diglyceride synthetase/phosphatidate cytidylyltransferase